MAKAPGELILTAEQAADLARLLTTARMRTYSKAVANAAAEVRGARALDLYVYNMKLAAALLGPLHVFEVVLRNALHERLVVLTGRQDWWAAVELDPWQVGKLDKAISDAAVAGRRQQRMATVDDVVAALDLGFWCGLVGSGQRVSYERRLWQPALQHAFPGNRRPRQGVYQVLNRIRRVRNRVGHHEPIHQVVSEATYQELIRAIAWISPPVAAWTDDRSIVRDILRCDPLGPNPVTHF